MDNKYWMGVVKKERAKAIKFAHRTAQSVIYYSLIKFFGWDTDKIAELFSYICKVLDPNDEEYKNVYELEEFLKEHGISYEFEDLFEEKPKGKGMQG